MNPGPPIIRALRHLDTDAFLRLRREALETEPLAFASSPDDDISRSRQSLDDIVRDFPVRVIIGAFNGDLSGFVGLYRDRHAKCAHKVHLWGMYVTPARRGAGIGATLLDAALVHARTLPGVEAVHLTVSSSSTAAIRLYERAGFHTWGTEPDALRHGGESVLTHHMALRLD